ncbi:hypothetical protein [Yeosuana sp.]|mgnify:CR=1 FL=1|uniref:hypothetical protein n=1 Tax=Yeosuana sp. TaxID=2529388 RepID=UPI004054A177|tara:strand:- start:526 stop:1032 length:507 start_codon:yes stop_codon:yes gene_type:complete
MHIFIVVTTEEDNKKQVFFKEYKNLNQIKKTLKRVKEYHTSNIQVSILGKFPKNNSDDMKLLEKDIRDMHVYWRKVLGTSFDFGSFKNPEVGVVFIAGPLTSLFLNDINGKSLGTMTTGIYGVLRGLGANLFQAETYLKALNNNEYLLIMRGFDYDLYGMENLLKKND